ISEPSVLTSIPETRLVAPVTTFLPPPPVSTILNVLPQSITPIPTPPITTEAPPVTTILDLLSAISQRESVMEKEFQELKKAENTTTLRASLKSEIPSVVKAYLRSSLGDALRGASVVIGGVGIGVIDCGSTFNMVETGGGGRKVVTGATKRVSGIDVRTEGSEIIETDTVSIDGDWICDDDDENIKWVDTDEEEEKNDDDDDKSIALKKIEDEETDDEFMHSEEYVHDDDKETDDEIVHGDEKKMSHDLSQKVKGVQTLTPEEQLAADTMEALKANRKSSRSQSYAKGSSEGTARYEIVGIEDMVPTLSSITKVGYNKDVEKGMKHWVTNVSFEIMVREADFQLYKFKEGDFVDLHLNDIEDMLLLAVQHKLFQLNGSDIVDLIVALRMFPRSLIIKKSVKDLQLGPEAIYKDLNKQKRVKRADELHKFSDRTLVRDELHYRILNFRLGYNKEMSRRK
nr:hypothetical protein [Tanacetum cinerariifolium]